MELENLNLVDEQGNQLSLRILNTFAHNEKQYAIMVDPVNISADGGASVYILKLEMTEEGGFEFMAPDEADMPEVVKIASDLLNEQSSFNGGCGGSCSGCSGCGHSHE